jgi:pimeloyl-ACP methyl ester carboxylesterase
MNWPLAEMTRKATSPGQSVARPQVRGKKRVTQHPVGWQDPLGPKNPLVSLRWLLSALGLTIVVAALCWYATLCLLFYQGQWQIVFHPSAAIRATPASQGIRFDDVQFDSTETGVPRMDGWWIPAETGGRYASSTVLFIHDGRGDLSGVAPQLATLHVLGINIFAFDFRGFGASEPRHPSEQSVYEDADAAVAYLIDTRHISAKSILLYGAGLGAPIAAEAALRHPQIPAVVVENPEPPAITLVQRDARTSILPVRLLFRDRFELLPKLRAMGVHLDASGEKFFDGERLATSFEALQFNSSATNPRAVLGLLGPGPLSVDQHYLESIRRFLDEALPSDPALLPPTTGKASATGASPTQSR